MDDHPPMKLELYTKQRCSLCEKAKVVIEEVQRRHLFDREALDLEVVDIGLSPILYDRFRYLVPVVAWNGQILVSLQFTAEHLEEALVHFGLIPGGAHK